MPNTTPKPKRQAARTPATSPLNRVDRELSAAAKASFMRRHGIEQNTEVHSATAIAAFLRAAKSRGAHKVPGIAVCGLDFGFHGHVFDHVKCWKRKDGTYVVTAQPYDGLGCDDFEMLCGLSAATGATIKVEPASWHFPMATVLIVLTLPAQRPFSRRREDGDDIEQGLSCPD